MLKPCSQLWGAATIIDSDPASISGRNLTYVPIRTDVLIDEDHEWGVYREGGSLVAEAAYMRLPAKYLVGQTLHANLPWEPDAAAGGRYVYGGPMILHYGHFITACLPRLWQIVRDGFRPGTRIVCHSQHALDTLFAQGFIREILGRLGLEQDDFIKPTVPTLFRHLEVPRPAMEEQTFGHRVFRTLCAQIGAPDRHPETPLRTYISKSRLRHGTTGLGNEDAFEARLVEHGLTVAHPELLSFSEQVRLFNESAVVIGTLGSAFHTSIFCSEPRRLIGLAYGRELNANYAIIDRLCGNDATYLYPTESRQREEGGSALLTYDLGDPVSVADAIADLL